MQLFKLNIIYEMLYTVYIKLYIYIIHIMMTNAGDKRSKQTLESKSQTNNLSNAIKFLGLVAWAQNPVGFCHSAPVYRINKQGKQKTTPVKTNSNSSECSPTTFLKHLY